MLTNSIYNDIKHYYKYGNAVSRLIFINVGIWVAVGLFYLGSYLFQDTGLYLMVIQKLEAPAAIHNLLSQPWSVFTYMFLHENILHILFNMLWLFWFGEIFVLYLGDKKVVPIYIVGGLAGAALYMLAYNLIPVFKQQADVSFMLGASASIYALMLAAVAINPDHEVSIILLGPVKIKYVALVPLLIDIISIPKGNAGGYIAHLGGALFGFLYLKTLQNGIDLFSPFTKLASITGNLFRPKRNVKVTYKNVDGSRTVNRNRGVNDQEKVDEILDKIARSGYDSLTKEEKDFLFQYSKK